MEFPLNFGIPAAVATSAQLFLMGLAGCLVFGIVSGVQHCAGQRRSVLSTLFVSAFGSMLGFFAFPLLYAGTILALGLAIGRMKAG